MDKRWGKHKFTYALCCVCVSVHGSAWCVTHTSVTTQYSSWIATIERSEENVQCTGNKIEVQKWNEHNNVTINVRAFFEVFPSWNTQIFHNKNWNNWKWIFTFFELNTHRQKENHFLSKSDFHSEFSNSFRIRYKIKCKNVVHSFIAYSDGSQFAEFWGQIVWKSVFIEWLLSSIPPSIPSIAVWCVYVKQNCLLFWWLLYLVLE